MPTAPRHSPSREAFERIREPLLREIARRGRIVRYPRHAVLINEGERGDTLFIILAGRVKVFSTGRDGREVILDVHGAGETVGEMALDDGVRSATVVTTEPSTCSLISRDLVRQHVIEHPDFALQLMARLIGRTRTAVENVKRLALLDVYGRVTALIANLAPQPSGVGTLSESFTQQELADRVGASRDMVSRILRDLTDRGYLSIHPRRIEVLKPLPPA
jgi:CRP/FNR family cyclic AMP-dependent transcriptional regulator